MTISDQTFDAWISSAEAPTYPNLFFIGTGYPRITFYSQQVRALELVHALSERGRIDGDPNILVVGGGAAGCTAALAFASLSRRVTLMESEQRLLSLQHQSPRQLHPNIYDLPAIGAMDPDARLPILNWSYGQAGVRAAELIARIEYAKQQAPTLQMALNSQVIKLEKGGSGWRATYVFSGHELAADFDIVVLSAGFGSERTIKELVNPPYWAFGNSRPNAPTADHEWFLAGHGDGGLTDLMWLLLTNFNHSAFTQDFLSRVTDGKLATAVLRSREESLIRADRNLEPSFERHVMPVLQDYQILNWLRPQISPQTLVIHNVNNGIQFRVGAAAILNQVMAYAISKAALDLYPNCLRISEGHVTNFRTAGGRHTLDGATIAGLPVPQVDEILLRIGPDTETRYEPFAAYYADFQQHRSALEVNNPALLEGPRLSYQTYDFFDARGDVLCEPAAQQMRASDRAVRGNGVVIEIDRSSHSIVQRGVRGLVELVDSIDHQTPPVIVRLQISPQEAGDIADPIVRLAHVAGAAIQLSADQGSRPAWLQLVPNIGQHVGGTSGVRNQAPLLTGEQILNATNALIVRRLDVFIKQVDASHNCPGIGAIGHTISSAVLETWANWKVVLDADAETRAAFLRLLWRDSTEAGVGWCGRVGTLSDLGGALFLSLAAEIGMDHLHPTKSVSANLRFKSSLHAFGSSCLEIKNVRIDNCNNPADWGVQALILSQARALSFDSLHGGGSLAADAGSQLITRAAKVPPAVIQNSKEWSDLLTGDINDWRMAVQQELLKLNQRMTAQVK